MRITLDRYISISAAIALLWAVILLVLTVSCALIYGFDTKPFSFLLYGFILLIGFTVNIVAAIAVFFIKGK